MNAGREMNNLVAEKVMGWRWYWWRVANSQEVVRGLRAPDFVVPSDYQPWEPGTVARISQLNDAPPFSTSIEAAWAVVGTIQRAHPGWRFCLLGGDVSMGYESDGVGVWKRDAEGGLIVDESSREAFGWNAEFMGELDPRENYGDRHGEARAFTAPHAICLAALASVGVTVE